MRIDCPGNDRESIVELQEGDLVKKNLILLIIQADHPSKLCKALSFRKSDIKIQTARSINFASRSDFAN